jgi:hypothetical protein
LSRTLSVSEKSVSPLRMTSYQQCLLLLFLIFLFLHNVYRIIRHHNKNVFIVMRCLVYLTCNKQLDHLHVLHTKYEIPVYGRKLSA